VDHLFGKIKPKKPFFMAVDGVAPRAKINPLVAAKSIDAFTVAAVAKLQQLP
jgi:5'-3' exonuclease